MGGGGEISLPGYRVTVATAVVPTRNEPINGRLRRLTILLLFPPEPLFELGVVGSAHGQGPLIVPTGQLDGRRFLGNIDDGKIVVGGGVAGFELDGFTLRGLGRAA